MGNLTHILPVLQWLEVVIAFVSSYYYYYYYYYFLSIYLFIYFLSLSICSYVLSTCLINEYEWMNELLPECNSFVDLLVSFKLSSFFSNFLKLCSLCYTLYEVMHLTSADWYCRKDIRSKSEIWQKKVWTETVHYTKPGTEGYNYEVLN